MDQSHGDHLAAVHLLVNFDQHGDGVGVVRQTDSLPEGGGVRNGIDAGVEHHDAVGVPAEGHLLQSPGRCGGQDLQGVDGDPRLRRAAFVARGVPELAGSCESA
ncbi:hypothetical protein [Streptomyces sp. NPDC002403]